MSGFYAGEPCPLCEKGRLQEASGTASLECEACGRTVRRAQLGDYGGDVTPSRPRAPRAKIRSGG